VLQNPPVSPNNPRLFDDRTVRKQTSYPKRSHPSHGSSVKLKLQVPIAIIVILLIMQFRQVGAAKPYDVLWVSILLFLCM